MMRNRAEKVLNELWTRLSQQDWREPSASKLPRKIVAAIDRSLNAKIKTYRYVLPTQLLAKLTNPALDCWSIQEGANLPNSFDARSLCHGVIVPFDRENNNVLGGSTEPYVNNPLRIPSITPEFRKAQKDKGGFDDLCMVLAYAEDNPRQIKTLFATVLASIGQRLGATRVVYPVPNRISLFDAKATIASFIVERTGGVRLQAVAIALFDTIGRKCGWYNEVKSAPVNASDASTGQAADLSCVDSEGRMVLAVEVKDRKLALRHVQDKLPGLREGGVRELLFLVRGGSREENEHEIESTINREFAVGQNIYVCEFDAFMDSCLVLFGESGRRDFMVAVGSSLDAIGADISHRRSWASALRNL